MTTCSFCGYDISPTLGKKFFRKDGKVLDFCSKKCETSLLKLKRVPRNTRWTKEYRDLKQQRKQLQEKKTT